MVHPDFEYYSNQLLAKIGKVIYAPTTTSRRNFPHIRGCVMCNLNEDLIEFIAIKIPGVGAFKVDVSYNTYWMPALPVEVEDT